MKTITLVTGNAGKLVEWQKAFPANLQLKAESVDLDEIQSSDPEVIALDKAKRAYGLIGEPVIVEDVAAGLDKFGGMPGPFMKFFEKAMGTEALYKLAGDEVSTVTIVCTVVYYDGTQTIIGRGEVHGTVVAPRGSNGFGFDSVVQLDGQSRTYGEMSTEEKNAISHRALAIKDLVAKLEAALPKTSV